VSERTALLCADIGNSHTTLGLLDDGEVVDHWRVATLESRTADEWNVLIRGLVNQSPRSDIAMVTGLAVCSTVPSVLHEIVPPDTFPRNVTWRLSPPVDGTTYTLLSARAF